MKKEDVVLVLMKSFSYWRSVLGISIDFGEIQALVDNIWESIEKDQQIDEEIEQVYVVTRQNLNRLMTRGVDTFHDIHGNRIVLQFEDNDEPPVVLESGTLYLCDEHFTKYAKKNKRRSSDKNTDKSGVQEKQKYLDEFDKPASEKQTEEIEMKNKNETTKMANEPKGLKLGEKPEDENLLAYHFGKMSIDCVNKGYYDSAIKYAMKKLEIIKKLNDKNEIANCYNFVGQIYSIVEEDDTNAEKYFKKEMQIRKNLLTTAQKHCDRYEMAKQYLEIGKFYEGTNENHIALRYYRKALIIFDDLELKYHSAKCLDRISTIYRYEKKNSIALKYKLRELDIYLEYDDKNRMYQIYITIGEMYFEKKNLLAAKQFFRKTLVLHKELGIKHKLSSKFKRYCDVCADLMDLDTAKKYFEIVKMVMSLESS
jgi:tetratricopeptide (TPR) repeat protein